MPFKQTKRWMTTKEVAAYARFREVYLRILRSRGEGPPYVRIGRAIRYDLQELDQWLESKKVITGDAALASVRSHVRRGSAQSR